MVYGGHAYRRCHRQRYGTRHAHPTEQHQAEAMRKLEEFNGTKQVVEFEATQQQSLQ